MPLLKLRKLLIPPRVVVLVAAVVAAAVAALLRVVSLVLVVTAAPPQVATKALVLSVLKGHSLVVISQRRLVGMSVLSLQLVRPVTMLLLALVRQKLVETASKVSSLVLVVPATKPLVLSVISLPLVWIPDFLLLKVMRLVLRPVA